MRSNGLLWSSRNHAALKGKIWKNDWTLGVYIGISSGGSSPHQYQENATKLILTWCVAVAPVPLSAFFPLVQVAMPKVASSHLRQSHEAQTFLKSWASQTSRKGDLHMRLKQSHWTFTQWKLVISAPTVRLRPAGWCQQHNHGPWPHVFIAACVAPDLLASSGPPNVDVPTKETAAMRDAGLDLRCFCPGRPTAWTTTWRPPQWRQRTEMPTWNNVGRMWRWRRILTLGARCQHVLSTSFKFVNFKSVFSRSNILNWQVVIKWSCHFYLRVRGITCLTVELEPPRRSNGIAIPRALLVSCPTRPKHWSKSSILLKHSGFGSPLCYLVWLLMVRFLPSQPLHTVGSSQWQSKHTPVSELFEHPFVFSLPTFTFKWWRRWSLFLDMFRHFPNMSWWCSDDVIARVTARLDRFMSFMRASRLFPKPLCLRCHPLSCCLPGSTQAYPVVPCCSL